MATIKLKRSNVAGKVPTTDDLELGEVAINTADGLAYIRQTSDPYADQVEVMLEFEGPNGGTTFTDSSSRGRTFTRNGTSTTISTAQFKTGSASGSFTKAGQNLSSIYTEVDSNLDLGTKDFTAELWCYPTSSFVFGTQGLQLIQWGLRIAERTVVIHLRSSVPTLDFFDGLSHLLSVTSAQPIPLNTWSHLAFVRSGSTVNIFVNGVLRASTSYSGSLSVETPRLTIGELYRSNSGENFSFTGYMDDLRITVGVARYTEDFDPSAPRTVNDHIVRPDRRENKPGDVELFGKNVDTGTLWIPANGNTFELGVYPELDEVFGVEESSWGSATKLANPDVLPSNTGRKASFSPDGNYLAIAHLSPPFVTIYKRNGDSFTKLANPDVLPTGNGFGASFSPDGNYLAIGHNSSPFVTIYKREGDTFTKLANPNVLPPGNGNGVSFSPDGNYLAIVHNGSPYVAIYKREGDTFTKLENPDVIPTGEGRKASFSPDGNYLAIGHFNSPYVTIYKRDGDTFTKLANPDVLPTGNNGQGASFSPDGNYLAIAHLNSPFVTIYKREGDTFTKLANPNVLPPNVGRGASFSPDGNYLAIAHYLSPYVTIYKRNGDSFTKLANPDVLPTGNGFGASFSPDGNYLAIVHDGSPRVTIYKPGSETVIQIPNLPAPTTDTEYRICTTAYK